MKLSKEVKIGVVVTAGILLLIWGLNFLKGKNVFSKQRKFYAVYDHIDGLVESSPILFNGFRIGLVSDIRLDPSNARKIVVTFSVDDDLTIPQGSTAKIVSADLFSKGVELILGRGKEFIQNGDTLNSAVADDLKTVVDKRIAPLQAKAEGLISSIDSVMIVVKGILDKNTRENLSKSFENIKGAIASFEQTSLRLDTMVATEKNKLSVIFSKIESITTNIASNNQQLTHIINNFSSISDSLAKSNIKSTIDNANQALAQASSIMTKINKGEGSIGMLINNPELYKKLESSSANLDKLLLDLRMNPSRYLNFSVIGRKDKNKPTP